MDFLHHYYDDDDDDVEDSNSNVDRSSVSTAAMMMKDGRVTRKRRKPSPEPTVVGIHNHNHSHHDNNNDSKHKIGASKQRRVTLQSRIPIVTETEYSRLVKQQQQRNNNDSVLLSPQPGRWSTHCSCTISLNRHEINRAHDYVQWLCRTIQQYCPTYTGHAILLFQKDDDHQPTTMVGPRTTTRTTSRHQSSLPQQQLLHVSLTRPNVALHHTQQIESFVKSLTIELQQQQQPPFSLTLGPTVVMSSTPNPPPPHGHDDNYNNNNDHQKNQKTDRGTTTAKMLLKEYILHDTTKAKSSFGIWKCQGAVASLQRLSDACNRVLGPHYQQGTYHYHHDDENNINNTEKEEDHHKGDPIYHVSLVRFEPCLHDYLTGMSHAGETTTTTLVDDDDDDDETSRATGEWSEDSDDDDDDESTKYYHHYVDHVTCQFGGGAKVYQIPLTKNQMPHGSRNR